MGLFKKKKKPKYVEEILEFEEQAQPDEAGRPKEQNTGKPQGSRQPRKNPAMEYCEQILTAAKALEETKREYGTATDYLTDIQTLEDLPEQEYAEIQGIAQSITALSQSRDAYVNKTKTISDSQFAQMEQYQDQIPEVINRLKSNETYQTTVKRDMQYLEGEREEWRYYKETLEQEEEVLRKILYILAGAGMAVVVMILILGLVLQFDYTMPVLVAALVVGAAGAIMVWRIQNDEADIKKSQVNINYATTLLNKISFKYLNVTNAVDYACEKYHVKNSYELNYIWEQYLEAVREREKYQRTNDELEFLSGKLLRRLRGYHLYDTKIWTYQVKALLDKKEMVEVKHELLVRRQKLRSSMESQIENIQKAKREIEKLVQQYPGHENEVKEILESLERICGIAA